ncbi:MAG: hypothetical protein DMG49_04605 [Acidobacteria bacterium]|nr:MAG: hypothetical protein DMG49_04605 [Acidobacteriota bacterium]
MLKRDSWRCQSCGSRVGVQIHHITPRSQLVHDGEENLITLCWECHRQIQTTLRVRLWIQLQIKRTRCALGHK